MKLEKAHIEPEVLITEAQRRCLSHILRNAATAMEGAVALVENRQHNVTLFELTQCLKGLDSTMGQVVSSLESGTFCALNPEHCEFVGKYAGCTPNQRKPGKGESHLGEAKCTSRTSKRLPPMPRTD